MTGTFGRCTGRSVKKIEDIFNKRLPRSWEIRKEFAMTTKEVVVLLTRIAADLTLMMGRPHDEHRLERLITDIRANIDRINREGVTK